MSAATSTSNLPLTIMRWRRPVLEGTFILAEAIAWYMVIAVLATSVERSFLSEVEQRLRTAAAVDGVPNPAEALVVADQLARATAGAAGPSILVVLLAAAGGFALMRLVQRVDFGTALGSVVLVAGTIVGVNLLLHLSMGHWQFWDASGAVGFIEDPDAYLADGVDLTWFIADPDVDGSHGGAIAITFMGLLLVWFRFLIAARSTVSLDRMARSFTVSFVVVLFAIFAAGATGYAAPARWAVPQFVVGMLGLAIGNHERAVPSEQAANRTSPWLTSVGGTLGLLILSALVLGLFAYLNAGAVLSAIGTVVFKVIEVLLIVVLTPLAWLLERIFAWFFNGRSLNEVFPALPNLALDPTPTPADAEETTRVLPPFIANSLKFFAVVFTVYVMYRVGRLLVGRREGPSEAVDESRSSASGGAGIGRLLADLVRFRRAPDPDAWMDRHPAYALYGRTVRDASDRGLPPLPTETPQEFARAAHTHLEAAPFPRIASMFERARFGRHFPPDDDMRASARDLEAWEREHPATEELRERVRGARQLDEGEAFELRITLAKRETLRRRDEDPLLGE